MCFECEQPGHLSRECYLNRNQMQSEKCGKNGHHTSVCRLGLPNNYTGSVPQQNFYGPSYSAQRNYDSNSYQPRNNRQSNQGPPGRF